MTREIKLKRRTLLLAGASASLLSPLKLMAAWNKDGLLISAASDNIGQHWALCLDESGREISRTKLPARAHEVLKHPVRNEIAIVGRRPGRYLIMAAINSGKITAQLKPEPGFHFYGHALFTPDGNFLITTENHIDSGQGRIFVREARNPYKVIKSFPSYGIGPHEVKLSSDQDTLVIANGGIKTHPEKGREKLNLDTMSPSLVYVSLKTGELLEEAKLDRSYHQLSIRHLDINRHDEVTVGMQYQGERTDHVPLVASHKRGQALSPIWAPEQTNYAMKHYCGSVRYDHSGKIAAISSPKGNLVTFWDIDKHAFITSISCKDGCGLASAGNQAFFISNGRGDIYNYQVQSRTLKQVSSGLGLKLSWDNHLALSKSV
jgi:hypothetical protein